MSSVNIIAIYIIFLEYLYLQCIMYYIYHTNAYIYACIYNAMSIYCFGSVEFYFDICFSCFPCNTIRLNKSQIPVLRFKFRYFKTLYNSQIIEELLHYLSLFYQNANPPLPIVLIIISLFMFRYTRVHLFLRCTSSLKYLLPVDLCN